MTASEGSAPIAIIRKNSIDDIRVSSREYKGHRFIDIRVFTDPDTGTDKIPTKKGIAVRPDLVPELINALQKALEAGPSAEHGRN